MSVKGRDYATTTESASPNQGQSNGYIIPSDSPPRPQPVKVTDLPPAPVRTTIFTGVFNS